MTVAGTDEHRAAPGVHGDSPVDGARTGVLFRRRLLLGAWRHPGAGVATLWLVAVATAAVAPGLLCGRDPLAAELGIRLQAPSLAHPFGTDQLGRDMFTRVVHGAGVSLGAASTATLVGLLVGATLGLLAGFLRGWADIVIMRIADVLLAIPSLLLSLGLIAALGPGMGNVAIAVGLASVAGCARIMRAEVLRVRESPYVEAALSGGARRPRLLLRHVLPNAAGPVWALAALEFGTAIIAVSALSFLGYGVQPPAPEWGSLVSTGRDYLRDAWWLTILPGLTVACTVLAANRISHALDRDGAQR